MSEEAKPNWWPENPYPESVFPMKESEYPALVPDEKTRTALSGMLARRTWNVCSDEIWELVKDDLAQLKTVEDERDRLREACKEVVSFHEGVAEVMSGLQINRAWANSTTRETIEQALTPDNETLTVKE